MPQLCDISLASNLLTPLPFRISKDEDITRLTLRIQQCWVATNTDKKLGNILALEHDLIGVLEHMESEGIRVDHKRLKSIGDEMEMRSIQIENEVADTIGERINLWSPKQLQALLFDRLKLTSSKKTKTGFSVDEEVLSELAKTTPIVALILEHRGLKKLKGTYVDGILKEIQSGHNRVHTTYRSLGAATGRMSSNNPNLQNIPAADNGFAADIKRCFIPRDQDHVLIVADYSQVELRILATLSGDTNFIEAFQSGEDIHRRTARMIYWVDEISSEMRRVAKTVNFWVVYGVTAFGLSRQTELNPAEAKKFIEAFFTAYPWVKTYYTRILEEGRNNGYVETYYGRRRWIPALNESNKMIRAMAEREATNMPIQWTAADVVKLAMVALDREMITRNLKAKMLLQVHDELVFDCPRSEVESAKKAITEIMESVFDGPVRLTVGIGHGENWHDAKG